MIWRLILASVITIAAVFSVVVAVDEAQFTSGSPLTGVFALADTDKPDCERVPPERLIGLTTTDLFIFHRNELRRGRHVRHRPVFLVVDRPGLLIRADIERGEAIELMVEPTRVGFEIVFEELTLANGDRVKRPRRADRPTFAACPAGTTPPWAVPS